MKTQKNIGPRLVVMACAMGITTAAQAAVIFAPTGPASYNVLSNGGFETGDLSGWSAFGTAMAVTSSGALVGNFSARTNTPSVASGPGYALLHGVAVTPGQSYVLSAYMNPGHMSADSGFYLDLDDQFFEPSASAITGTPGLQFVYGTFTVPAGFTSLTVRVVRDGPRTPADDGLVDEVAVTPLASFVAPSGVPEPAAAGVLAPLALGLARRARRS